MYYKAKWWLHSFKYSISVFRLSLMCGSCIYTRGILYRPISDKLRGILSTTPALTETLSDKDLTALDSTKHF